MNDLEAISVIATQMAFALRPFAELAAPLVDQKVSTAIGLKEVDFENARLALHQWSEALPTIDWNNLDRARVAQLEAALKPFVELADKRDDIYRKRGGNGDAFPDYHPAYDITAEALPLGVWRRARAALKDTPQ